MKRPHRSIETFDISLMAVITKAMGAFLVLMLLLMPYYSSSPLGKDEAQDLAKKVQDADAKIKGVLDRLGDKELGKSLTEAREELGSGQQLINQLRRYVDQLSAQVTRLEERLKSVTDELEKLRGENARLSERVATLEPENARLQEENAKLKAELEELRKQLEEANKQIAQMQMSAPEQVAELKKRIQALEAEIARLKEENAGLKANVATLEQQNTALKSRVAELEQELAQLRARVAALEKQDAALRAQLAALQAENAQLKAQIAALQRENLQLKAAAMEAQAKLVEMQGLSVTIGADGRTNDCAGERFIVGTSTDGAKVGDDKYVVSSNSSVGNSINWSLGRTYGSSLLVSRAAARRFYFYLLFRRGDDGPLLRPTRPCTAMVVLKLEGSQRYNMQAFNVPFDTASPITYFADGVIEPDGRIHFGPPSDAGKAYLDDQLAHAKIEEPGAAAPTPSPADQAPADQAPAAEAVPDQAPADQAPGK